MKVELGLRREKREMGVLGRGNYMCKGLGVGVNVLGVR